MLSPACISSVLCNDCLQKQEQQEQQEQQQEQQQEKQEQQQGWARVSMPHALRTCVYRGNEILPKPQVRDKGHTKKAIQKGHKPQCTVVNRLLTRTRRSMPGSYTSVSVRG